MLSKREYENDEHARKTWKTYEIYLQRFIRWNDGHVSQEVYKLLDKERES